MARAVATSLKHGVHQLLSWLIIEIDFCIGACSCKKSAVQREIQSIEVVAMLLMRDHMCALAWVDMPMLYQTGWLRRHYHCLRWSGRRAWMACLLYATHGWAPPDTCVWHHFLSRLLLVGAPRYYHVTDHLSRESIENLYLAIPAS